MTYLIYILAFAALLGVLVTIHEFGHFIVARIFKVHVQRFSIGMGPVFFKRNDKHGTEFALSAIPLGGYVSMITNKLIELEPEIKNQLNDEQIKNTFDSKPKWQRASIMFAGPLANFILSILIFTGIFLSTPDPQVIPVIKSVNENSLNFSSPQKFQDNDQILQINNKIVKDSKDINLELLSFAGYTGEIVFKIFRPSIDNSKNIFIKVENFLPTSDSQSNPVEFLGLNLQYKMQPYIGDILSNGPAEASGIKPNDKILSIGNRKIEYAEDIRKLVSGNPNKDLEFKIIRGEETLYLPVNIGSQTRDGKEFGILGVSFGTSRSFVESFNKGLFETYNLSLKTLQFIGKMITGNMGTQNLSGPIGIAQMAGNTAQAGFLPFMYLMALLSISLAVLNLLPIPVLDGGQLTLLGIEAIRGKPLPEKAENIIYSGGAVLVGMLMIFAIFNDISRFL